MVPSLGATIIIIRSDMKGHRRGQSRRRRWCAWSHLERRLLHCEIATLYQILYMENVPALIEAISMRRFKVKRPHAVFAGTKLVPIVYMA